MKFPDPPNRLHHLLRKANRKGRQPGATSGYPSLRHLILGILYLILLSQIVGCTGMSNFIEKNTATRIVTGAAEKERRQNILLSDRLQLRAKEYEKGGEIYGALLCWQVLSILNPVNQNYAEKFQQLKNESQLSATLHFEMGKRDYNNKLYETARREFLIALRYNPDHSEALDYLKNKMTPAMRSSYRVKMGDTLVSIAENVYQDPNKYYLIAVYNQLDVKQALIVGTNLKLPALEPDLASPLADIPMELKNARKLFLNQAYEKVLQRTALILNIDPSNTEAAELKNAALYQIADRLRQQHKYLESLAALEKMDPRYKGVQKDIAEVKVLLQQQAEENYRIGVNFFVNEQIKKAIESWEKTLNQNPNHPKARQDIEKARRLLKKLKEVD